MVRYFILLCGVLIAGTRPAAQELSRSLESEERVFNFGTIKEKDGKVSHTFYFRNTGSQPVELGAVNTGCGCLVETVRKGAIAPGEKAAVTITFNPAYKSGFFSKEILVFSENGQRYNRVWMEGQIIAAEHPVEDDYPYNFGNGLHFRLKVLAFGYLKPGASGKIELHFANENNREMTLGLVARGNTDGLHFNRPGKIAARDKGVVTFTYTMPYFQQQDVNIYLDVYADGVKMPEPLQLRILNENKINPGR